ncbi:MAG: glycoside hydrolase family 32 protein [Chitinophagaceae bacterium]|nr:glycoside hydrolase family 32 protein [Chitinophagaceae bacterium]
MIKLPFLLALLYVQLSVAQQNVFYKEPYRPQYHFTPAIHWMNDPNGLVYHKGEYHLFYQFNPFGNKWGHMSWGHAVSSDLIRWQHLPLAIPEEKDTMIFSGSCVVDEHNSSGFATQPGQVPMVAIYTAHIEGKNQSQHIAYSLDDGRTWTKYNANPVLDLGKKDFRDPKVFWYKPQQKWVMAVVLPIEKQAQFYSSKDLKQWQLMSSFGPAGDTTGIWECPDLFEVPVKDEPGKTKWVLMHSPAPYMQYFIGEFDGYTFTNSNPTGKIYRPDYGPDYYAAIVYNNLPTGQKPVSIGWVNNWNYAQDIPTTPWKSAMSLPRELSVKKINNEWILLQEPVEAINTLVKSFFSYGSKKEVSGPSLLAQKGQTIDLELKWRVVPGSQSGVRLAWGGGGTKYIEVGYDEARRLLYIDRSKAGETGFNPAFGKQSRYETPLESIDGKMKLRIFFDKSIVEVFANDGQAVMTAQLFPDEEQDGIMLFSNNKKVVFETITCRILAPVW